MFTRTRSLFYVQVEVLILIMAGIITSSVDSSFLTLNKDMKRVWGIRLDPYKFPPLEQLHLKYIIQLVLIVRTFTVHILLAFYVVALWPAFFSERPNLLIPWLIVGTIRLTINFISTITGLYICKHYGFFNTRWIEFLMVQILSHGPFFYTWLALVKYRIFLEEMIEWQKRRKEEQCMFENMKKGLVERSMIQNALEEEEEFYEEEEEQQEKETKNQKLLQENQESHFKTLVGNLVDLIIVKKRNLTVKSLDTLLEIIDGYKRADASSSAKSPSENTEEESTFILSPDNEESLFSEQSQNSKARHGRKHDILPSKVNYRANIWALKQEGCNLIIVSTATGSLREDYKPGDLVILDNFIDRTHGRNQTFYDGSYELCEGICHIPIEPPYCEKLRNVIIKTAEKRGIFCHRKGTIMAVDGPRFSSKAESSMFRLWGGDLISMTTCPEVVLAKEAGISYAGIALITDYDCWKPDTEHVSHELVLKVFKENIGKVVDLVCATVGNLALEDWDGTIEKNKELVVKSIYKPS